jgi:hypothetical protein
MLVDRGSDVRRLSAVLMVVALPFLVVGGDCERRIFQVRVGVWLQRILTGRGEK